MLEKLPGSATSKDGWKILYYMPVREKRYGYPAFGIVLLSDKTLISCPPDLINFYPCSSSPDRSCTPTGTEASSA